MQLTDVFLGQKSRSVVQAIYLYKATHAQPPHNSVLLISSTFIDQQSQTFVSMCSPLVELSGSTVQTGVIQFPSWVGLAAVSVPLMSLRALAVYCCSTCTLQSSNRRNRVYRADCKSDTTYHKSKVVTELQGIITG